MNKILLIALLALMLAISLGFSSDEDENQAKYTATKEVRDNLDR